MTQPRNLRISGSATATDLISPILVDHHKKVSFIAATLGKTLALPLSEVQQLALAGAVHDIGGLSIRRRLDSFEFEVLEPGRHTLPGYLIDENRPDKASYFLNSQASRLRNRLSTTMVVMGM